MKILIASNNEDKLREFKKILNKVEIITPKELNINIEPEEKGETLEDNAQIKAEAFWAEVKNKGLVIDAVVSDDTGVFVEAYPELIGVKAHRWHPGTIEDRNKKLIELMNGQKNRNIYYKTILCFISDKGTKYFEGYTYGEVSTEIIKGNGFAYDMIFKLTDGRTISQMSAEEKSEISSRGLAAKKLAEYILQ